jgi:hypothetical protein
VVVVVAFAVPVAASVCSDAFATVVPLVATSVWCSVTSERTDGVARGSVAVVREDDPCSATSVRWTITPDARSAKRSGSRMAVSEELSGAPAGVVASGVAPTPGGRSMNVANPWTWSC